MTIADMPRGLGFTVVSVTVGKEIGKRLADMGFTQGAEGVVLRRGSFGGPLHIRLRGYDILIRKSEAQAIEVEALPL
ncbi:MAG TPA: FeoA domain-containing protein [Spirochaetales bacterium]|nr:FeoA domain-containing protein [Spirochaetales bacterium]